VIAEIFLSVAAVVAVKQGILYGMWVLIPALAAIGATGFVLARRRSGRLVANKTFRMRLIAMNGLLVLLPAAFFLHGKAVAGQFDPSFYVMQAVELVAGFVQLVLIGLNARDGLRLTGRLRPAFGIQEMGRRRTGR
jgi:hypothetical protein